jgi:hypothetical protein
LNSTRKTCFEVSAQKKPILEPADNLTVQIVIEATRSTTFFNDSLGRLRMLIKFDFDIGGKTIRQEFRVHRSKNLILDWIRLESAESSEFFNLEHHHEITVYLVRMFGCSAFGSSNLFGPIRISAHS